MPLKGVLCDSALEAYNGEKLSFDKCLSCARVGSGVNDGQGLRWCDAPYALIKGMSENGAERSDAGMSATMVLDVCPRRVILQQETDYYERPSKYWPRFRGTIGHLMMEAYDEGGEGIVQEVRFTKDIVIDGVAVTLTGKADHCDTVNGYILDYKSVGSINTKPINLGQPKPEHEQQISIYRWLTSGGTRMDTGETVDFGITRGALVYFDMKGTRKIRAQLMSLDETEEFLIERLRPFVHYELTGELPPLLMNGRKRHFFCDVCPVREVCDKREGLIDDQED